ncbi:MAG: tryptophan-rich sensory protein [Dehalococcoidia bacterium]|nr:tryptophan-rich sensory protein [Dehalococcoidia bacterium]
MNHLMDALNRDDRQSLVLNIVVPLAAALILHGLVFFLGLDSTAEAGGRPWFQPPYWAAAIVWLVLFVLMGSARWMLNSYTIIGVVKARNLVTLLIAVCLLWPFYVLTIDNMTAGLLGTIAAGLLSLATIVFMWIRSRDAALLVGPTFVWLCFMTIVFLSHTGRL